jgi:hypothetical protein
VTDFYWFAGTGFGINLFFYFQRKLSSYQLFRAVVIPGLLAAGVFYLRSNFGPRHGPT